MAKCLICEQETKLLGKHIKKHNITPEQYCIEYKSMNHNCLGCGKETKFTDMASGFKTYCKECGQKCQSKEFLVRVFGEELGLSKWQAINDKRKFSNSKEGWLQNHGEQWVEDKMKELALGPAKVKEMRKDPEYNAWYLSQQSTTLSYYLKRGMTEEEAKEALAERQRTFNLEKCIERYGEEEGLRVWQERQDKWQDTLKAKPPEEIQRINKLKATGGTQKSVSGPEKRFLDYIETFYGIQVERQVLMFFDTINNYRSFDGRVENILIEFQGTYWHCDPRVYESNFFHVQKGRTAEEIWDYDLSKQKLAKEHGYKVFVVWEKDCEEDMCKELERFGEFYESQN